METFCSSCHKFPPPDTLPRSHWKAKVEAMYALVGQTQDTRPAAAPPIEEAVRYFTERAPERLPPAPSTAGAGPGNLRLRRVPLKLSGLPHYPGVAHAQFVHLHDDKRLDLLVCEMRFGMVLALDPARDLGSVRLLARVPHPCHAEVVDLDGDGRKDILVADLGTVVPSDSTNGAIVWLRPRPTGEFEVIPLANGLGRVAEVRAADFDGDGDQDLVAAVFGWRRVGEILYLERTGTRDGVPSFEKYTVDQRVGAITVPVVDLNADRRPDFLALLAQHHESIIAFHNTGRGRFEPHLVFSADHPNWGSSSLDLVDLDGDGDQDLLLTNGDTLDDLVLKPYHGVEWLENTGKYPYPMRRLANLPGAHRTRAADLDGDGDLDLVTCAFLPFVKKDMPGAELAESLIWLEQTAPGQYTRHSLETASCTHPTMDAADFDQDGDIDIVVGNMTMAQGDADTLDDWMVLLVNERVGG